MKSELFKQKKKKIISEDTECNTRRKGLSPLRNEKEKIQRCLWRVHLKFFYSTSVGFYDKL